MILVILWCECVNKKRNVMESVIIVNSVWKLNVTGSRARECLNRSFLRVYSFHATLVLNLLISKSQSRLPWIVRHLQGSARIFLFLKTLRTKMLKPTKRQSKPVSIYALTNPKSKFRIEENLHKQNKKKSTKFIGQHLAFNRNWNSLFAS